MIINPIGGGAEMKIMYRTLRLFSLFIVFSAVILLASSSSAATYHVYGGPKAFWPDGSWIPVPSRGDPDDGVTERLDFSSKFLAVSGNHNLRTPLRVLCSNSVAYMYHYLESFSIKSSKI